jgi:DNA-binding protein HU-beta
MNKKELGESMAGAADISKAAAEKALNGMLMAVTEALTGGDKVTLVGFGTFSTVKRSARKAKNPRTGELINMNESNFAPSDIRGWRTWAGNTLVGGLIGNDLLGTSSNGMDWNLDFQIVSNGPLGTVTAGDGNGFTFTPNATCDTGTNIFNYRFINFDGLTSGVEQVSIVIPENWDGDTIPDSWEAINGLSPTNAADATGNNDGDTVDNYDEYIADTDPTDSNDYFCVTAISNNSPVTVYFNSSSNRLYRMNSCSNLVDGIWTNVPGTYLRMGVGGADSLNDTNEPPNGPFYRLEVELP